MGTGVVGHDPVARADGLTVEVIVDPTVDVEWLTAVAYALAIHAWIAEVANYATFKRAKPWGASWEILWMITVLEPLDCVKDAMLIFYFHGLLPRELV